MINMKIFRAVPLALVAAHLVAAAALATVAAHRRPHPVATEARGPDWSRLAATTEFGWRMGNPAAPHKLVEYGALNCPHCAHFDGEAHDTIVAAVRSGKASFEYRPFPIFALDPAATLIARCLPAPAAMAYIHEYYATQPAIQARWDKALTDPARRAAIEAAAKTEDPKINKLALDAAGLAPLAGRHGLGAGKVDACITAKAQGVWLDKAYHAAQRAGVQSTPTLILDGKTIDIPTPAALAAMLAA